MREIGGVRIYGIALDGETRCAHYDESHDVIAIRFHCCGRYYPCFRCHEEVADHPIEPWPGDRFDEPAVRCGACGTEHAIGTYLAMDHASPTCPACDHPFNPGCANHHGIYFDI